MPDKESTNVKSFCYFQLEISVDFSGESEVEICTKSHRRKHKKQQYGIPAFWLHGGGNLFTGTHIESLICNICKPLWAALIKMAFLQDRKLVLVLLRMTGVRQLGFHFWLCHRFPV